MLHPTDHAAYLARHDFRIPGDGYTPTEIDLLTRYGRWLEALAAGAIAPMTPGQERFVRSARGEVEPETDFERVWAKVVHKRNAEDEVRHAFQALAAARAEAAAADAEYSAARSAVLAQVRNQLDAVDAAFAERIQTAADVAAATEQALRALILKIGKSVSLAGIRATYSSPRVTWDTKGLDAYAHQHPEVNAFRKLGKPTVALRFLDRAATDTPAEPPALESSPEHAPE